MKNQNMLKRIVSNQLFIPIIALLILTLINLINDPSFFKITLVTNNAGNPMLSGSLRVEFYSKTQLSFIPF